MKHILVLVVCNLNHVRSPWIGQFLCEELKKNNVDNVTVETAGLHGEKRQLTKEMIEKANIIFAADEGICKEIIKIYSTKENTEKIFNLDIPDIYEIDGQYSCDLMLAKTKEIPREEWPSFWNRLEIKYHEVLSLEALFNIKKSLILDIINKEVTKLKKVEKLRQEI